MDFTDFFEQFRCLSPVVLAVLRNRGVKHPDDEDALQEAWLRTFQQISAKGCSSIRDPKNWLLAVAIHHAARAKKRNRLLTNQQSVDRDTYSFEQFDQEEEDAIRLADILGAVELLPQELEELFIHYRVKEHTIAQTALKFGLPLGTANGRLIRAAEMIRQMLNVKKVA